MPLYTQTSASHKSIFYKKTNKAKIMVIIIFLFSSC